MLYYNEKTKEWVTKIGRRYVTFSIRLNQVAIPFYVAKHWSGLVREKYNTTTYFCVFCFHLGIGYVGPIVRDDKFPFQR